MFTHLMRSLPPETVEMHARQIDTIAVECMRELLGLTHIDLDSAAGIELRERMFMQSEGLGMMSCARFLDAAYIGHWALVGPTVEKMLRVSLKDPATMALPPLIALQEAAKRVEQVATDVGVKRLVQDLPMLLSNEVRGIQGVIGKHLRAVSSKRFLGSFPVDTEEQQGRKRAFVSGSAQEAAAGIHVSNRDSRNHLTNDEYRVSCALRLGVDAFPPPPAPVKCPDCRKTLTDFTAHALSCPSKVAQGKRTGCHTAMDVVARAMLCELDPAVCVTSSHDAYPYDHGMRVSEKHPEAINHRADAYVFDVRTGHGHLIDFTYTNAEKSTGKNGAKPGSHADAKEAEKIAQYREQFPDLSADSSPALVINSMERHGSWSEGTKTYWKARITQAHERQKLSSEFPTPLSVLSRRVVQTLAVALRRVNASHILQFHRRALHGAQRVQVKVGSQVQVADDPEPEDEGIALALGDGPVGDCP